MGADPIYNVLGEERLASDEDGPYVEMWDGSEWTRWARVHRLAAARIAELETERDAQSDRLRGIAAALGCPPDMELRAWAQSVRAERDALREAVLGLPWGVGRGE